MIGIDRDNTRHMMAVEVACLIRSGLSQDVAEAIVGGSVGDVSGLRVGKTFVPTPKEILERTAAIRAGWADRDTQTNRVLVATPEQTVANTCDRSNGSTTPPKPKQLLQP